MASGRADYTQKWLNAKDLTPIAVDDESGCTAADVEPDHNEHNQGLATRLYQLSRQGLQQLCRQEEYIPRLNLSQSALKEELGRLYLWGEAFENGKLDKALEQSEDLRDTVLEFLCAIGDIIVRASQPYLTLTVKFAASPEQIQDLRILTEQAKLIISRNVDHASSEGSEDEGEYGVSKDEVPDGDNNIAGELQFHIGCLVDLGSTLEKSLLCTETGRVRSSQSAPLPFHISGTASVYISIIRDKFKDAEVQLIERLGEANWQRHVNVRLGMANVISDVKEEYTREDPCSTFKPYSAFYDSGIGPSIPTQIQYAPSHTSFVSSVSEKEEGRLRVPREPVEVGAGRPFQCYLCGEILSNIRNRGDWKCHVFADLQPYICTFADCDDKLVQFSSRAAWADHEFTKHRINRFWSCPECPEKSSTAAGWAEHLEAVHQRAFYGPSLEVARVMAYSAESKPSEKEKCPFCQNVLGRPRRTFVKHVGSHMEEIALMVLPRDPLYNSEDKSVISQEGSMETSQLPASSYFTQSSSLPGLSRIMVPDPDSALEPTTLPPLRSEDPDPVLGRIIVPDPDGASRSREMSHVPHRGTARTPANDDYLQDRHGSRSTLPRSQGHQASSFHGLPLSVATSRLPLPTRSDFTLHNSLPYLSRAISSRPFLSVLDKMENRQINSALRILVPDPDGALEPNTLPPLERAGQDSTLECPFTFLKCFRQFAISNERDWIQHSLEHFRIYGERPRRVDPPQMNSCCFCSQTFQASSGIISWRARMDHVKVHQQHFGHRLAAARHDFALIEYFWQNGLLSIEDYRVLKQRAKAVEEDPQSLSPGDPGSLVEEKVMTRAPRDSERKAVHGRRK